MPKTIFDMRMRALVMRRAMPWMAANEKEIPAVLSGNFCVLQLIGM